MAKDSDDRDARKRVRKQWPREINYPEESHGIFSKPIVMAFKNNPTPPTVGRRKSSEASFSMSPRSRDSRYFPRDNSSVTSLLNAVNLATAEPCMP